LQKATAGAVLVSRDTVEHPSIWVPQSINFGARWASSFARCDLDTFRLMQRNNQLV
jgi:hypothetical protein